CARTPAYFDFW
nr:immunoglobulin heavy chain junction region [Macaca mulatta]